ncbi:MAG: PCP reductase family protein [Chloroflexi bacterium]|nr:PCP reductase family protein [Chloroflexota bacterium]
MHLVRSTLVRQRNDEVLGPQECAPEPPKGKPVWTEDAEKRLENVPALVRGMARKAIERYALEQGFDKITLDVMDRAKQQRGF